MLVKKSVRSRNVCKVTFVVPEEELPEGVEVESITVVGEFNDWVRDASPIEGIKHQHSRQFSISRLNT